MRYCMTGPSACSQLTERVLVVGSYTRMFLGPLRGTEEEKQDGKNVLFVCVTQSKHLYVLDAFFSNKTNCLDRLFFQLKYILTCLSNVTDGGSFTIAIQGHHSNIVTGVREQLLQQGRGGGPWYHNLCRDTEHVRRVLSFESFSAACVDFSPKPISKINQSY